MRKIILVIFFIISSQYNFCQKISICANSIQSSFRGLSVVNNRVVWVSGNRGTVGRSLDGGKSWKWMKVKGFSTRDFRDIEAFSESSALVMAVDSPAYILQTINGGTDWKVVYKNDAKGMFLDAMEFRDEKNGTVVGDPINGFFFIIQTSDGGNTWENLSEQNRPKADTGEACFAASGTNIRTFGESGRVFVSGRLSSHIFINDKDVLLPILQGKESTGANSIALKDRKTMVVVGGDFLKKDDTTGNCALSVDGGNNWIQPKTPPSGYRSCVEYLFNNKWITCGLNGIDISNDNGLNWQKISNQSFNVVRKAKKGTAIYFAGSAGLVGKLEQ